MTAQAPAFVRDLPWPSNPENRRGTWTDGPCYYVSVVDGERVCIAAGPFQTHEEALARVDEVKVLADKADPKAHWYAFGTCKAPNGWREGKFNPEMGL